MTDRETLDKARALFVGQTQGDTLAREVIVIAENRENVHKAGCVVLPHGTEQTHCCSGQWIWDEDLGRPVKTATPRKADTAQNKLADLRAQRDELWEQLTPLKDAVLYARSQRRPMGIGQDSPRTAATVRLEIGIEYGREKDNAGFWIDSDDLGPQEADSPDPTKRIALALIRLAYAVAEKVKPQK